MTSAVPSRTHCKRGHPFSGKNLHVRFDGTRCCRACWRIASKAYKTSHREKIRAYRAAHRAYNRARSRAQRADAQKISAIHPGLTRVVLGRMAEQQVAEVLRSWGYTVQPQKQKAPFDLLAIDRKGRKYRVEVRSARVFKNGYVEVDKKDPSKYDMFVTVKPDGEMGFRPRSRFPRSKHHE
jgi:hypothetical protein